MAGNDDHAPRSGRRDYRSNDPYEPVGLDDDEVDPFDSDAYEPPEPWYGRKSPLVAYSVIGTVALGFVVFAIGLVIRGSDTPTLPPPSFVDPSFSSEPSTTDTTTTTETITSTSPPVTSDFEAPSSTTTTTSTTGSTETTHASGSQTPPSRHFTMPPTPGYGYGYEPSRPIVPTAGN